MSLKRVEIIPSGPSVGDWVIKVNDVDITDMVVSIVSTVIRSERKPTVSIVLTPETLILPKVLEVESVITTPIKSRKSKDK